MVLKQHMSLDDNNQFTREVTQIISDIAEPLEEKQNQEGPALEIDQGGAFGLLS